MMNEEMRRGVVELRVECFIEESNEEGKVWAKPLRSRSYLIDSDRVEYTNKGERE